MANATFNAGIDYFGLETATTNALKVKSSAENRSKQSSSGANSYGDITVVDSFGDTAAPSAEYEVIAALASASFPVLGTCATVASLANPVVLGTVTINTSNGAAPTVSASGSMVQSGAATLREYTLPTFSLTARHRAQDFLAAVDIKIGDSPASDVTDYGLASVSATFPIEITLAQPKGVVANYDLHGGTATASYTMNWYASTAPTIVLTAAAAAAGYTISSPVTKACPENGYTQYTWTVSLPMTGEEASV
jgi:hypothetical protein